MSFPPEVTEAVLSHMNDDHAQDSLTIVRAHGYPAARSAEMTGVDEHGGTWHVVDAVGEASVRIGWLGGEVTERAQLRQEVVRLFEAARATLPD
ncbi:DUF2470 domain-containing protein [Nocardioidaceae bacterium]|nr:DUF2470 domain-containing protein [Nocardioidaceae bacterium]